MTRTKEPVSRPERGASAVEYGLLVAAIAAVIMLAVFVLGRFTEANFGSACDNFEAEMPSVSANC